MILKASRYFTFNSLSDTWTKKTNIQKMSENFTSSSLLTANKAPALDPKDFASWEMMFQIHVGFEEWELFGQNFS